jgi:hypothetical protein
MVTTTALTKSSFLEGVRCQKSLWLATHREELSSSPDDAALTRMRAGQRVGAVARQHISGGYLIAAPSTEREAALEETKAALARNESVLYEAAFTHGDVFVRVDILRRSSGTSFDVIEVKSSTSVKDDHVLDLAVQRWVLEGSGLTIRTAGILHLNGSYVRAGAIDPARLFVLEDQTVQTAALACGIGSTVATLRRLLGPSEVMPTREIGKHCDSPYPCSFTTHCWSDVPDGSIYEVSYLGDDACSQLRARGILLPAAIPVDFPVPSRARVTVEAARDGKEQCDRAALRGELGNLQYPLCFLDFEAIGPGIPPFDGTKPYDVIPFQFSLHIQDSASISVRHAGLLANPLEDFRASLAEKLADALDSAATICHWTSYEPRCINRLADWAAPAVGSRLRATLSRLWDMAGPFQRKTVVLPATLGKYSVKQVLPTLVSDLSYEDLEVADGLAAARAFEAMMDLATPAPERARLAVHLERYCERDTLAMVRILEALRERA